MKVLVVDFIYNIVEHVNMNCDYINALSKLYEVTVYAVAGFYDKSILGENVELIEYPSMGEAGEGWKKVRDSLCIMYSASKLDREKKYDVIFALTFDTRTMAIGYHFFKNPMRIYLMNHYNIDALEKKLYRFFYRHYKNRVHQLVLETYFIEPLIKKYGVKEELVHYIPHKAHLLVNDIVFRDEYDCVGISNSNDEKLIDEIIQFQKEKGILNGKKVVLRSKLQEYDDGYLKVINKYLPEQEYAKYINCARQVFMPYPDSFKYRLSGVLYEAFTVRKKIITTDILFAREFSKRYEGCCTIVKSTKEFIEAVLDGEEAKMSDDVYTRFMSEHSEEVIIDSLRELFCKGMQ